MFLRIDALQIELPVSTKCDPNAAAAVQELLSAKRDLEREVLPPPDLAHEREEHRERRHLRDPEHVDREHRPGDAAPAEGERDEERGRGDGRRTGEQHRRTERERHPGILGSPFPRPGRPRSTRP